MDSGGYFTTNGDFFDYLVKLNKETGREPTFVAAMDIMLRKGLLLTAPPPVPPYHASVDREEFGKFIRALPISSDLVLNREGDPFDTDCVICESNLFPKGKDVFCFLNMPYMDRRLHFHDFFEITYLIKGSCTFLFEGETASLGMGDICITSPMAGHSLPLEPGCMALAIVVRKSTFNSLFSNLLVKQDLVSLFFRNCLYERQRANYIMLRTGTDQDLLQTAQMLTYESNITDNFSNSCSVGLLNLFLARAMRAAQAAITLYRYENYREQDFDFTLILQYIQQNYRTVTLSTLAGTFHFSETYMSKMIRRKMGQSFTEVLRSVKMNHAIDHLKNTSMKISEISEAVGYDSVDHFSRTFRRVYGVSPQQYRQKESRQ